MRVAILLVVLGVFAALSCERPATSSSTDTASRTATPHGHLGIAGGAIPADTSVFDDEVPGVVKLDADLLAAVRRAATDAGSVRFTIDSGWRSPAYQEQLLQQAVSKYGSEAEAARWVATPQTSAHVKGRRSTSAPQARRGCPSTAPRTACAACTATSPGTTSCARTPPSTAALPSTPTPPTIQGCSSETTRSPSSSSPCSPPAAVRTTRRVPPPVPRKRPRATRR